MTCCWERNLPQRRGETFRQQLVDKSAENGSGVRYFLGAAGLVVAVGTQPCAPVSTFSSTAHSGRAAFVVDGLRGYGFLIFGALLVFLGFRVPAEPAS